MRNTSQQCSMYLRVSLVVLLMCLPSATLQQQTIPRPNYGLVFEPLYEIQMSTSYWYHTIAIDVMKLFKVEKFDIVSCKDMHHTLMLNDGTYMGFNENETCNIICNAIEMYNNLRNRLADVIKYRNSTLGSMFHKVTTRHKRYSLFSGIGKIYEFLFGVLTEDDQLNMDAIESRFNQITGVMHRGTKELTSYRTQTDTRISNLWKAINVTSYMTQFLANNFSTTTRELTFAIQQTNRENSRLYLTIQRNRLMDSYLHYLNLHVHGLHLYITEMENFISALDSLKQNYLPSYLVNAHDLENILSYVQSTLQSEYPTYKLVYESLEYYYNTPQAFSVTSDRYLYIHIKLPLHDLSAIYRLYSVLTVPIPLFKNSTS